jgi:flavin-dependent dehydrogenase
MNQQLSFKNFAAVIIGAGPAGCHCARIFAKSGASVLLVEQHENFLQNNYSSAGSPRETLAQFDLPETVVARFWRKLEIVATNVSQHWESPNNLGVVFDFAKLRKFLAKEVEKNGGEVWMGYRYLSHHQESGKTTVCLKQRSGEIVEVNAQILVDATGYARAVMYPKKSERPAFYKGTGIEYLIEVGDREYQKYCDSLVFFLGHKWSPKGYSWIFPMNNNQLKVGSAWIDAPHKYLKELQPLREYVKAILTDYMALKDYRLIEIHGSILEYSSGLNDCYYRDNIIAIGDAVSTVNFLGGEGIRHAMEAAEIANRYIQAYLLGEIASFKDYQTEMQEKYRSKWNTSEAVNRRVYLEYSDAKIDRGIAYLKYLKIEDIVDILFYYKFNKFTGGLGRYLLKKLQRVLTVIKNKLSSITFKDFLQKS